MNIFCTIPKVTNNFCRYELLCIKNKTNVIESQDYIKSCCQCYKPNTKNTKKLILIFQSNGSQI